MCRLITEIAAVEESGTLGPMELIEAVMEREAEMVAAILHTGMNPNYYQDMAQLRPLHFAAQAGALDIAFLLLEAGADPQAETDCGQTPLEAAKLHSQWRMVQLLGRYL